MDANVFAIIWDNARSEFDENDLQSYRTLCRSIRDVIDQKVTKLRVPMSPSGQWRKLAEEWHRWPELKELDFYCEKTPAIAYFLPMFLSCKWKRLEKLRFVSGSINESAAQCLCTVVSETWTKLRALSFDGAQLKPASVLRKLALAPWGCLEELSFDYQHAFRTSEDGEALAFFLSNCPSLKKLTLSEAILSFTAFDKIMDVKLPLLEHFDGCYSRVGPEMVKIIADKSDSWPSLRILHLVNAYMQSEGLIDLCKANFPMLEELDLSERNNTGLELNEESLVALRTAIEQRWSLKALILPPTQSTAYAAFLRGNYPLLEFMETGAVDTAPVMLELARAAKYGRLPRLRNLKFYFFPGDDVAETEERFEALQLILAAPWPGLMDLQITLTPCLWGRIHTVFAEGIKNGNFPRVKWLKVAGGNTASRIFKYPWKSVEELEISVRNGLAEHFVNAAIQNLPNLTKINFQYIPLLALKKVLRAPWPPKLKKITPPVLLNMKNRDICKLVQGTEWKYVPSTDFYGRAFHRKK